MANERKQNRQYIFTVEGETEQWYFEWLRDTINNNPDSKYTVSIISKVQQSPKKYAKTVIPLSTPLITHICDCESNSTEHITKFHNILGELKDANSKLGKKFKYELGYSNYTFELWMILHKKVCNGTLTNRKQYLPHINQAYQEKFQSLDEYKEEANFKRCLSKLSLNDVCNAINRAQNIMHSKTEILETPVCYKGFSYYKENPALTIWESIAIILKECGLFSE